jgi:hypothetical protein
VFGGAGAILKRAVPVGLRGMACVPRLGEEAQIGQAELSHDVGVSLLGRCVSRALMGGVDERRRRQRCQNQQNEQRT